MKFFRLIFTFICLFASLASATLLDPPLNSTSVSDRIYVQSTVTSGTGLSSLTSSTAGLTAYYIRPGDTADTPITLTAGTVGSYTSFAPATPGALRPGRLRQAVQ